MLKLLQPWTISFKCFNNIGYVYKEELSTPCRLKTLLLRTQQIKGRINLQPKDNNTCSLCHEGNHPLYLCSTFRAKSVEERFSTATRLKVCMNCLSYNHFCRDCPSRRSCKDCGARHHSLLHRQSFLHAEPRTLLSGKQLLRPRMLTLPQLVTHQAVKLKSFWEFVRSLWNLEDVFRRHQLF